MSFAPLPLSLPEIPACMFFLLLLTSYRYGKPALSRAGFHTFTLHPSPGTAISDSTRKITMNNANAFKQANDPRGTRKHVAAYMSRPGRTLDERIVGYWGEGHHSPLDEIESCLNAYSLANPAGFQILAERLAEMIAGIRADRELTLRSESQGTSELNREWSEFLQSRLEGQPISIQRKELLDVVAMAMEELRRMDRSEVESSTPAQPKIYPVRHRR